MVLILMGLINQYIFKHFPVVTKHLIRFQTIDCLGNNTFNWEVRFYFNAQVDFTVELPILSITSISLGD